MPKVPPGARFYAVAKGRQPGLYYTWEDCHAQVYGFTGCKHQKLRTYEEAVVWLASNGVLLDDQAQQSPSPPYTPTPGPSAPASRSQQKPRSTTSEGRAIPPPKSNFAGAAGREPRAGPSQHAHRSVGAGTKLPEPDQSANVHVSGIEPTVVYCDGACKGNGKQGSVAGVGVFWGEGDERNLAERCPGVQTNNRAELIAIVRVLQTVPIDEKPLIIRTDSQYSINCMTKWLSNWRKRRFRTAKGDPVLNKEIICYIDALLAERKQAGQQVTFEHVYGHQGELGNEGADRQANLGCLLPEILEDEDWKSLEEETHERIATLQADIARADEELFIEAMSDDGPAPAPMSVDRESPVVVEDNESELEVEAELPSTPPPSSPPRTTRTTTTTTTITTATTTTTTTMDEAAGVPQTPKSSPFKPAPVDTPQFTTPTSSPSRPPPPAAASDLSTDAVNLSKEELESYADCLVDMDELEAELSD